MTSWNTWDAICYFEMPQRRRWKTVFEKPVVTNYAFFSFATSLKRVESGDYFLVTCRARNMFSLLVEVYYQVQHITHN